MRPSRIALTVGLGTALVAGLAVPAASAATAPRRHTVHLHVSSHHHITAPAHTAPGLAHLVNTESRPLYLLRSSLKNVTTAQVVAVISGKHASHKVEKSLSPVTLLDGHSNQYVRLGRGHDFLFDPTSLFGSKKNFAVKELTVSGATSNATPPASVPVTVRSDKSLAAPRTVPAGHYLHLRNDQRDLVILSVVRVSPKTTDQQLAAFLAHPSFAGLFGFARKYSISATPVNSSELAAGADLYVPFATRPARYVVAAIPLTKNSFDLHPGQAREIVVP